MLAMDRREHRLLLACSRPRLEARDHTEIAALLGADLDWTSVVSQALDQGVTPALLAAFEIPAIQPVVPPEIQAALSEYREMTRARNRELATEIVAILSALMDRGVVALPFKGPLLAMQLYGDVGQRAPGDLDFLVRQRDVTTACDVLTSRGFRDLAGGNTALTAVQHRLYQRYQCEYQFIRDRDGIVVEPHWAAAARTRGIDLDYEAQFARARSVPFHGASVLAHAPEDLLLILCVHGAKHRWEKLSWIRDVAALVARSQDIGLDVELAVDRAREAGHRRFLLLGLDVARQMLGVSLSPGLDAAIARDRPLAGLVRSVAAGLFTPRRSDAHEFRIDPFTLRLHDRMANQCRHLARTLLAPRREHLEIVALPDAVAWLYYPLRWAHDYLAWPLWMLTRPFHRSRRLPASEP
jgi:hypothetical protein